MNPEVLASQLVRALRGKRSQAALGRRLGYTSNVVYAWESGRRSPLASDLFRIAQRLPGLDARLRAFVGTAVPTPHALEDAAGVAALLVALSGGRSTAELARAIHKDRSTVARWLRGHSEPKLPELFTWVQAVTQRLLEFIALFVDPSTLAETRVAYRDLLEQRRLAYDLPWSHAVLRALELSPYRERREHDPGFVAERVGISRAEEAHYLAALVAGKQLTRSRGRYRLRRVLTVDTRPSEADNRRLKLHWADVARARFAAGELPEDALFSYNLFAIDAAGYERIRQLHLEYYERVRELVASASTSDRVVLVNLQLVPLDLRHKTSQG